MNCHVTPMRVLIGSESSRAINSIINMTASSDEGIILFLIASEDVLFAT